MSFNFKIFSSPSFYIRVGLFIFALVLCGLLFLQVNRHTWLLFKSLSVFATALIAGGTFGQFRTLPFRLALSQVSSGLFKFAIGFVVICCALAALVFWMADPLNLSAPADQKLIMIFHDHRAAFERLREMATEDRGRGIFINQYDMEGNITEARKQEYQTFLSKIYPGGLRYPGLEVRVAPDGSARFIFTGGGVLVAGDEWFKGIAYIPEISRRDGVIVPNLDKANTFPADTYLREIEPNWYIFYESFD